MESTEHASAVLDVLVGPFRAYCLVAAVELGVPDALAGGPRGLDDLADEAGAEPDALGRLLRMLISLDIVRDDGGEYRNTVRGDLLRRDHPDSMRDLVVCYAQQFYPPFRHIGTSIRTGAPAFPEVFGSPVFDHYADDPEAGRLFDGAMAAGSTFFAAVPRAVDFSAATRVVDVAGGDGSLLAAILREHPHLEGTLAEAPRVAGTARRLLADPRTAHRSRVVECDIFDAVPAGADLYVLSRILHDWDDRLCRRILGVVRDAMPAGSCLLVIERLIPDSDRSSPSLAVDFDLHMLVNTGGRERSLDEYEQLLTACGFDVPTSSGLPLGLHAITSTAC